MAAPKGFENLVKIAMKERPEKPKNTEEMWEKFLYIVFMGGKRSDPEIYFLINILKQKNLIDLEFVKKTDGEDWRDEVNNLINDRLERIRDDSIVEMLKEFQKEIFRISASIKGGARFFKKNEMNPERLKEMLSGKEKTWEFIENLASDEDVSNIKYTKIIVWLHSMGYAFDFCPPSWQTKKFVNDDIGPYYQFYEDDKYFMKKSGEFAETIKKKVRGSSTRDVSSAIFYYITMKSMLPLRSKEKKKFNPALLMKFMKSKKMTLKNISEKLTDFDEREKFIEDFYAFMAKA